MLRKILVCGLFVASILGSLSVQGQDPVGPEAARRLWQNGRFAEALEVYDQAEKSPGKRDP